MHHVAFSLSWRDNPDYVKYMGCIEIKGKQRENNATTGKKKHLPPKEPHFLVFSGEKWRTVVARGLTNFIFSLPGSVCLIYTWSSKIIPFRITWNYKKDRQWSCPKLPMSYSTGKITQLWDLPTPNWVVEQLIFSYSSQQ